MRWLVLVALVACGESGVDNHLPSALERTMLADEVCPAVTHPFFYRVERDGKTNYLYGTRHVGVGLDKLPQFVRDTLFTQKLIVFETPGDDEKADFSGPAVREELGPADWKRYREIAGDRLADALAPKSVVVATVSLIAKYEDFNHRLDKEIRDHAKQLNLPTRGLETEQFQVGVLKQIMSARMLRVLLLVGNSNAVRISTMRSLGDYCNGREHPDYRPEDEVPFVAAGYTLAEIRNFEDTLLYSRNRAWIPQLEQMFADGNVAVVVGAGHLQGSDQSVPVLLRAKGYSVERVDQ